MRTIKQSKGARRLAKMEQKALERAQKMINSRKRIEPKYKDLTKKNVKCDGRTISDSSQTALVKESNKYTRIRPDSGSKNDKKAGRVKGRFAKMKRKDIFE